MWMNAAMPGTWRVLHQSSCAQFTSQVQFCQLVLTGATCPILRQDLLVTMLVTLTGSHSTIHICLSHFVTKYVSLIYSFVLPSRDDDKMQSLFNLRFERPALN